MEFLTGKIATQYSKRTLSRSAKMQGEDGSYEYALLRVRFANLSNNIART